MNNEDKPCYICGKPSKPFGYVNKGAGHVCSKACDAKYRETRFKPSSQDQK
jgi:recombinational DNA repair protein (RecF pathway)